MEKKIKFILMGLGGILLISIILNIQISASKKAVEQERNNLKTENASLSQKVEESQQKARRLEEKLASLTKELERISNERENFQRKVELLNKEREDLIEKLKAEKEKQAALAKAPEEQKVPSVPEDSYWAGILKTKADLGVQLENIRSELKGVRINNEQLQREKSSLDLDINNLTREKQELGRQIDYNKKVMDSITVELVREKNDKMQLGDILKTVKGENSVLRRQLRSLNSRKIDLEKKIQGLQEDKTTLERRLNEMESLLRDQITNINNLKQQLDTLHSGGKIEAQGGQKKESVELPPIVVRPQETVAPTQEAALPLSGKVLAVNRENNFAIIDLGEDTGVNAGETFQVYREDRPIATIEVIQVRKEISACDIKRESTPIQIGDTVK
jgi:DNA repair exonuclease SbcCD ATPase subunit